MKALTDILLFKKITWDPRGNINRIPYIIMGIIAWVEIISVILICIEY